MRHKMLRILTSSKKKRSFVSESGSDKCADNYFVVRTLRGRSDSRKIP